jgi:hypothetical protein
MCALNCCEDLSASSVAVGRQARRRRQIAKYAVLATHSLRVVPRHVTCRSFDTASH